MLRLLILAASLANGEEVRLPEPPLGLDLFMPVPEDNPLTREKVALGRKLFFDKRLSRDGSTACATCHLPERAFSDSRAVARGVGGADGPRNSPSIVNRGYGKAFFWDGRAATLEQQAIEPILSAKELGLRNLAEIEERAGLPVPAVAAALASYVRTIRSGNSPVDRYLAGDSNALSALERRGMDIFRLKGNCVACHIGPNFTDEQFHNTGVAWRDGALADPGRDNRGAFKTPTLREIARTAPYMHDGSVPTLEDVIDYYAEGGRGNPNLDPEIRRLELTPADKQALVAFLMALSGEIREAWR